MPKEDFPKILDSIEREVSIEQDDELAKLVNNEAEYMSFVSSYSDKTMDPLEKQLKIFTASLVKYQWRTFKKILIKLHEQGFFSK